METSHTAVEARLLDDAVRPGAVALDAGCGRRTRLAGRRPHLERLVGVDLDPGAGADNDALDTFVAADCCGSLPFADGTFDLVYANFVIEHLERPVAAFLEWRRVLRPGGSLVVLTTNAANPLVAAFRLLPRPARVALKSQGAGARSDDVIPARYRANTPRSLVALLARCGFGCVELHCVATLHRYLERRPRLAPLAVAFERSLPTGRRSTIVARFVAT